MQIKAVHRMFDETAEGEREITLYVSDGESVESISGAKALKLIAAWPVGPVRFSDVKSADAVLLALHDRGITILHAHWHSTGIPKGSSPEQIAKALALLPEGTFRQFIPDAKIAELRNAVAMRDALIRYQGDAQRRLLQLARNLGTPSKKDVVDENLLQAFADMDEAPKDYRFVAANGRSLSWETRIAHIAKTIPQCQMFARVACVESLGTAASLVAAINGIDRFESVAGLWKFCGQHVVDGKSPKRAKGCASDWSPRAKVVLYLLGVAIQKNNANPWNAIYRRFKERELSIHHEKHPGCKTPQGHCDARARRLMVKEILKRFYLEAKGERFLDQGNRESYAAIVEDRQAHAHAKTIASLPAEDIDSLDQRNNESQSVFVEERHPTSHLKPELRMGAAKNLRRRSNHEGRCKSNRRRTCGRGRPVSRKPPLSG